MFIESLRLATRAALSYGLSVGNARMIAADAAEDAWHTTKGANNISEMPKIAEEIARQKARRERFGYLKTLSFSDIFEEENTNSITVGIEPTQERDVLLSLRLQEVQTAMRAMNQEDEAILRYMLMGMSALDIGKEIRRAVPLVIGDIKRIRERLSANSALQPKGTR